MFTQAVFILSNIILLFFFIKKIKFFGIKESFILGLLFYLILPFSVTIFFEEFLISNFPKFNGYNSEYLIKFQLVYILMIISYIFGYSINKINIKKYKIFKYNFSKKELIVVILILLVPLKFHIPNLNPMMLMFILAIILISKFDIGVYKKILIILFLTLLFQFISSYFSGARRDIIKILLISMFFLSINFKEGKKQAIYFTVLLIFSIVFIFYTTYLRTDWTFYITFKEFIFSSTRALVQNYDFMPAFDNLIFILENEDFLYGQTVFKVLFSWVPRSIWFFKPEDTHTLITQIRENSFVGGHAAAVTLLGEFFWNFSYPGILIGFFLIGFLSKNFDAFIKKNNSDLELIIASSLTYIFFLIWRGSISTTLIIYLINIISIIVLLFITKLILNLLNEKKN